MQHFFRQFVHLIEMIKYTLNGVVHKFELGLPQHEATSIAAQHVTLFADVVSNIDEHLNFFGQCVDDCHGGFSISLSRSDLGSPLLEGGGAAGKQPLRLSVKLCCCCLHLLFILVLLVLLCTCG